MDINQASETVKKKLAEALNKKAENTASISKEGDEWIAVVEIVEEQYLTEAGLKSMNDIIGIYEAKLNSKGELISWNKKNSRKRGKTASIISFTMGPRMQTAIFISVMP